MKYINTFIHNIHDLVWNPFSILLLLGSGIYFSFRLKFVQIRLFPDMLSSLIHNKFKKKGNITFYSFAEGLSGRVGTGNIGGVAIAIAYGGPGAVVWMSIFALFGAALCFIESCLAQLYKENNSTTSHKTLGGTAYYIEKAHKNKKFGRFFALFFAILVIISSSVLRPEIQAHAITNSVSHAFGINPYYIGIIVSILLIFFAWLKLESLSHFLNWTVPFFTLFYILLTLYTLVINYNILPHYFEIIFKSAFNFKSATGGLFGSTISWGIMRGIYSNEAGTGTTTYASSQIKCDHPITPALEQSLLVFIDTIIVCTATSFLIISTNSYNIIDLSIHQNLLSYLPNVTPGSEYVQVALTNVLPRNVAYKLIAIFVFFFSFSTLIAFIKQIEANILFICSRLHINKLYFFVYKPIFLISIFAGIYLPTELVWMTGDIGIGILALFNLINIFLLYKPVINKLREYEQLKKIN